MAVKDRIKDLRRKAGLTQKGFAEQYDIPIGTLRDWEQGRAEPPAYVVTMLERIVSLEEGKR